MLRFSTLMLLCVAFPSATFAPQFKNDADARKRLELYRKKQPYRQG